MVYLDRQPLVWGITGDLGGGKTLTSVSIAIDAMRSGYMVVSNILLDIDGICKRYGQSLRRLYKSVPLSSPASVSPWDYPAGDVRGNGRHRVLIILDEIAEWFDQYQLANQGYLKEWLSWLRHSSKLGQDVFVIVQRPEYVNKSLRLLISRWVTCDNLAIMRLPIIRCRLPFMGGFILQRVYDKQGQLVDRFRFLRKNAYGKYYNTGQLLGAHADNRGVVYYRPVLRKQYDLFKFGVYLVLFSCLSLIFCLLFSV